MQYRTPRKRLSPKTNLPSLDTRYDISTYTLDLSRFSSVNFNDSNSLRNLKGLIESKNYRIRHVILSHNNIANLSCFEVLNYNFKTLERVDLSNNSLADIEELQKLDYLRSLMRELDVTNNPLLSNINRIDYKNTVKSLFPYITKLDGKILKEKTLSIKDLTIPLYNPQNFNKEPLRCSIKSLENTDWVFEISCQFIARFNQLIEEKNIDKFNDIYNIDNSELKVYLVASKDADSPKTLELVKKGREEIVKWWSGTNNVKHFPKTFTIDIKILSIFKEDQKNVYLCKLDYNGEFINMKKFNIVKEVDRSMTISICKEENRITILNDLLVLRDKQVQALGDEQQNVEDVIQEYEVSVDNRCRLIEKNENNRNENLMEIVEKYKSEYKLNDNDAHMAMYMFGDDYLRGKYHFNN
eukprot:GAHX01001823.1.p1 GENE.GAHX01001823.1~~GAHX01001823.1.p1  ORF type:complete len:412 (+),score=74.84 GAHX01001823.1:44-1279(+)